VCVCVRVCVRDLQGRKDNDQTNLNSKQPTTTCTLYATFTQKYGLQNFQKVFTQFLLNSFVSRR